ncbi:MULTISPECIES: DNA-processing protein DprA [Sporosarcina]|uniref:DNA-processing protein DprA n=1 Tax=Sporosarcina contaminans TaxID=633403 RepID=A0ABW3TTP2_9BACL
MNYTNFDRKLMALHYAHPVPYNRLKKLVDADPRLDQLFAYNPFQLSELLNISFQQAKLLHEKLSKCANTPFAQLYEQQLIIPLPYSHSNYPEALRKLIDPPAVLYIKGDISLLQIRTKIAIIGSRKATDYSRKAMSYIVPPLVQNGIAIVSGLAKGADTMAHEAALLYGGKTIAILGHGFFHLYPKENEKIAKTLSKEHLLLTEYPPYLSPARWTFPMRNRLISGFSDAVIITESEEKSGTMSTVEHALDHGKDIYAVPGPITSSLSFGPNKLIEEGAKPIWNGFQLFEHTL